MSVQLVGLQITLVQLEKTTIDMVVACNAALDAGGDEMLRLIRRRVSRTDHTQADLDRKGNPYARRHGTIQANVLGGMFVQRPWMVHTQSGKMLSALRGFRMAQTSNAPTSGGFQVDFGGNSIGESHAEDVILGTNVMLPRDPMWETLAEPYTRKRIYQAVVKRLGKELRSKVGIRFGSGKMRTMPGAGTGAAQVPASAGGGMP